MKLTMLKPKVPMAPSGVRMVSTLSEQRLRGQAAVDRRARYLRLHPLCCRCTEAGRTTAATVPDHIQPLWAGGPDDLDTNGQPLCQAHHDAKTKCEARMRAVGAWLATPCTCGQHEEPRTSQEPRAAQAPVALDQPRTAAPAPVSWQAWASASKG